MVTQIAVNYYKISKRVEEPVKNSRNSACYDIKSCFHEDTVKAVDTSNNISTEKVKDVGDYDRAAEPSQSMHQYRYIDLLPGWRYLIPTGIIFDIPDDYSMRIHPRSGLVWKNGITVANCVASVFGWDEAKQSLRECEGIVDSDYYHETFVMLQNVSEKIFTVWDFSRIAQIEFHADTYMALREIDTPPGV